MSARRVGALARYAIANNARTPYTWVGALVFLAIAGLGLYSSARSGRGWVVNAPLITDGAVAAAVFVVRSGLVPQRVGGLRTYLAMNFVTPAEHMAAAITGLLASWLGVCTGVFLLNALLPGGGLEAAAWQVTVFALRTGVLLPFVVVAESTTTIELPFFLPALAYFGLVLALVLALGEADAVTALAPPMETYDYRSTVPSLARVAVVLPGGFAAVMMATADRSRLRAR